MASVTTHGPTPNARSTIRASPMIAPWMENIAAWPLRSARIDAYIFEPPEAVDLERGEVYREREVASAYAEGETARVTTPHCPGCAMRIVNTDFGAMGRWRRRYGQVLQLRATDALTWRKRNVDRQSASE